MPSDGTFPIFRVAQWGGSISVGGTTHSARMLFDTRSRTPLPIASTPEVMLSRTVSHRREPDNGEFVEVTSSRRESLDQIDWGPTVHNMLIEVMRDELRAQDPVRAGDRPGVPADAWHERARKVLTDIDEGRIPTTLTALRVDDAEVEFQAVPLGRWWGAGAILDEVAIQMEGRMVSLDGLTLESAPEYQET